MDFWKKQIIVKERNKKMNSHFTRNLAEVSDTFICKECGIHIEDYSRVEFDEEDENDITHYEYEFKYCPECGRKIEI